MDLEIIVATTVLYRRLTPLDFYHMYYLLATWDDPDEPDSPHYAAFKAAYKSWAASLKILIPSRAKRGRSGVQPRPGAKHAFEELKVQPEYIAGGTLKNYQLDGLK